MEDQIIGEVGVETEKVRLLLIFTHGLILGVKSTSIILFFYIENLCQRPFLKTCMSNFILIDRLVEA